MYAEDKFLPSAAYRPKGYAVIFLAVFSMAMTFAAFTRHAWEDYYITYRASKNLAMGNGLVYTPGQRVHSFTSPLGVLIPAMLSAATGNKSDDLVLWLFRIFSSSALAAAALLLARVARRLAFSWIPATFLIGMFALDTKILDFTINGMETGILLLFVGLALSALAAPGRFPALALGVAFGGLMWTRPDSFIYIGGLGAGFLIFSPRSPVDRNRAAWMKLFAKACFVAALLYLPWIIWSWQYYGSPIPHTVFAKGLGKIPVPAEGLKDLLLYPVLSLFYKNSFAAAFLPPYAIGGWPDWLMFWSRALAWPSAIAWIFPRMPALFRAVSFSLMLGGYYLDEINPFPYPWYLPTCTLLSLFVLSGFLQQLPGWIRHLAGRTHRIAFLSGNPSSISKGLLILALSMSFCLSISAAWQLRIQQKVIEEGNRKQIGLWLAEHAGSKSDTVFLEPLGYIGFYSQLKMLDYPGLCSPEIVAARKKLQSNRAAALIREVKPIWLVLRAGEVKRIAENDPELLTRAYNSVKTFDVSAKVSSYAWLPGRGYLMVDQTYTIFKRNELAP